MSFFTRHTLLILLSLSHFLDFSIHTRRHLDFSFDSQTAPCTRRSSHSLSITATSLSMHIASHFYVLDSLYYSTCHLGVHLTHSADPSFHPLFTYPSP